MAMDTSEKSPAFHGIHNYRLVADVQASMETMICPMFEPLVPAQNLVR